MMPEIKKLIEKIANAKWITAMLIAGALAVFVWINFDFITEVTLTLKNGEQTSVADSKQNNDKPRTTQLSLGEIIIPPKPETLPSIIVFEVKNKGSLVANNVRIRVDYGVAKVIDYEILGQNTDEFTGSETGKSILNIDIYQIRPHENVYIYAQTDIPSFKKITISSDNTISVIDYTIKEHIDNINPSKIPDFYDFLFILFGIFITVMSIFFTIVLILKLIVWLKIE